MDLVRDSCSICGRDVGVKIFDAIIDGEVKKICEFCAAVDDSIVLIQKPTAGQLKEAERPFTVYERMRRAARMGLHEDELALREAERKREAQINLAKLAAVESDESFRQRYSENRSASVEQGIKIEDLRAHKPPAAKGGIDFKSPSIKIGDLKKMRDEMFGRQTNAETISEKGENDENS